MRLAFVTEAVPNPGTSGGDAVSWAIVKQMRDSGHEVRPCCCLVNRWGRERPEAIERHVAALAGLNVQVELLHLPDSNPRDEPRPGGRRSRWHRAARLLRDLVHPMLPNLYAPVAASVALAPEIQHILERDHPQAILAFDTGTVAALQHVRVAPRMAIPGDPPHLAHRYRRRLGGSADGTSPSALAGLLRRALARRVPGLIVRMLRHYESVGMFGAQHAEWLRTGGIDCLYLCPPVVDTVGTQWQALRAAASPRKRPKILILGNLVGTASLAGLGAFAEISLPALESRLGPDGFELHLVGRGTLPPGILRKLARPAVHLRGYVEDAAPEFLSADVFVSATPYPVGVRTRIAEAFSFGCCVVTHPYSALGLPELAHEQNVLLAEEGDEMAEAIVCALRDAGLRRRLGEQARRTYEENFHPRVAAARIVRVLERLAHE